MKKIIAFIIGILFLLSFIAPITAIADSQSTTVRYSVPATVIYMDYDGTSTTQKIEVGTKLKAPAPKGKPGCTFFGWKNEKTGQLWDFSQPVTEHLTLTAAYREYTDFEGDKNGDIQIGEGEFSVSIEVENYTSDISVKTSSKEILNMLLQDGNITSEEIARIENGASLEVILVVKDGTATISDALRTGLEQAAGEYVIGQYLDISLIKYLTVNGQTNAESMLTTTSGMITVTVKIPDGMINTDKSVERSFIVLRNHEGTVQILDSRYDADNQTLTFQTNQFSDYAIAYKDVKKSGQTDENAINSIKKDTTTENTSRSIHSPQTGDVTDLSGYAVALIASVTVIIGWLILRKKKSG